MRVVYYGKDCIGWILVDVWVVIVESNGVGKKYIIWMFEGYVILFYFEFCCGDFGWWWYIIVIV